MPKKIRSGGKPATKTDLLGYRLPTYHPKGKKHYVDFYAVDPVTGQLKRKKYHLDNCGSRQAEKHEAALLVAAITEKLQSGWNPWIAEKSGGRAMTPIDDVLEKYLTLVSKDCRQKTIHSYTSRVNILKEYISGLKNPPRYVYQCSKQFFSEFLDYVYLVRNVSPRTRNNYMQWCYSLCEMLKSRGYLDTNPCEGFEKVKEKAKKRQPLTVAMLKAMYVHLKNTDPHFLLACLMEYFCFIRPQELSYVKLCDISLKGQTVFVPADHSKNKKDGKVALPPVVIRLMVDLRVFDSPSSHYLFSHKFRPGAEHVRADHFNKRWVVMRGVLKWGDECQFYSLKDTGIRDLANREGIVTARDQARHSDISTTNKYLQGADRQAPEKAKHDAGIFDGLD